MGTIFISRIQVYKDEATLILQYLHTTNEVTADGVLFLYGAGWSHNPHLLCPLLNFSTIAKIDLFQFCSITTEPATANIYSQKEAMINYQRFLMGFKPCLHKYL